MMNKEYIERKALLKTIHQKYGENLCFVPVAGYISMVIEDFYAADVVEVKHGKWVLEREPDGTPYCFHCSICDDDFHCIGITAAYNYCPNCGAKMDGE